VAALIGWQRSTCLPLRAAFIWFAIVGAGDIGLATRSI